MTTLSEKRGAKIKEAAMCLLEGLNFQSLNAKSLSSRERCFF
jgi:hypothetical protein